MYPFGEDIDLDPYLAESEQFAAMYESMASAVPKLDEPGGLEQLRAMLTTQLEATANEATAPSRNITIPGPAGKMLVRVFDAEKPAAVYLDIHGGGWSVGDPRMDDEFNSRLSRNAHVTVLSAAYRLAPEHPYPAGVEDVEASMRWVLEHLADFGVEKLILGGLSAGAHLVALCLLQLRDAGVDISAVVGVNLHNGVYDLGATPSQKLVPGAGTSAMVNFFTPGMTTDERRSPEISPLYADLSGLPPALFTGAALDDLLDDTLFLAARWKAAGNAAHLVVYPASSHVFTMLPTKMAEVAKARMEQFIASCATGKQADIAMLELSDGDDESWLAPYGEEAEGRYIFGSPEWLKAVSCVHDEMAAEARAAGELTDAIDFTMCEVYTDVPADVNDKSRVAWTMRVQGEESTFEPTESDDVHIKIVSDWMTVAPLGRLEYDIMSPPAKVSAYTAAATAEGKMSMTITSIPDRPESFSNAHNRFARVTR